MLMFRSLVWQFSKSYNRRDWHLNRERFNNDQLDRVDAVVFLLRFIRSSPVSRFNFVLRKQLDLKNHPSIMTLDAQHYEIY